MTTDSSNGDQNSELIDEPSCREVPLRLVASVWSGRAMQLPTNQKKYEIDVTGEERYVPCLGEFLQMTEGTWMMTEDGPEKQGKCFQYNYQLYYKNRVTIEGQDSGRVWTGQGSKNRNFTVCPLWPEQETVTNRTTVTSETAEQKLWNKLK